MSSLKRKQPDMEESNEQKNEDYPPKKKMKTNKTIEGEYQEKRNKIMEESENRIKALTQQIEKEKESTKNAIQALDKEFSHYLQSQNETIQKPDTISVHFKSEQSATNDDIDMDFAPSWTAEFRVEYEDIFGYDEDTDSVSNQIKLTNTFPKLDIVNIDPSSYFVLGTASFWIVQMERLCNIYGLDSSSFCEIMDAQCQELADLLEIMDIENPGAFKFETENESTNNELLFYQRLEDRMNEGGEHQNIILIDRVKVNPNLKGYKLGRMLVQRIIDNFGNGQCRVVLKPFPLQWEAKDKESDEAKQQFQQDRKKVIDVWETMGFKQMGNSDFWGRNEAHIHPMKVFER